MNRFAVILTVVILPAWVLPAPADGIFGLFGKKTKVNPAERVPELIMTLKTEQDERKRSAAASELGTFDAATFAEIVPVLVEALQHDPKSGVRMDAASSLGSLRPVSQLAGQALEKAVSGDDNWRARWHAKGILLKYRMAGYAHDRKSDAPGANGPMTGEPPLLDANGAVQRQTQEPGVQSPARSVPVVGASMSKTPWAAAKRDDTPEFRPSVGRPLPLGPVFSTAVPPQSAPTPAQPLVITDGPPLPPVPTPAPATPPPPF